MEHVAQETVYFQAVGPEPEEPVQAGQQKPSGWATVRRWCRRKLRLIDNAVEVRIARWGHGT